MPYGRPRRYKPNINKNPSGTYWIYGFHTVLAALNNPNREIKRVVISKNISHPTLKNKQFKIENLSNTELKALLPEGSVHQGIACLVEPLKTPTLEYFCEKLSNICEMCICEKYICICSGIVACSRGRLLKKIILLEIEENRKK